MACGCGGKDRPTRENPAKFGEDNGVVLEVIASVSLRNIKPNVRTWVTGTHVQTLIDQGWLALA